MNGSQKHQSIYGEQYRHLLGRSNTVLLHSYAAQGCGVASLAEGMAVPLIQFPLRVRAGIWNLARVPAIAHRL